MSMLGLDAADEDGIAEDAAIGDGFVEDAAIGVGFVEDIVVAAGTDGLPPAQTVQGIVKVAVSGVSPQTVHTVKVVVKPGEAAIGLGGVGMPEPVEVMV